ncbi:MAG TPA: Gfo/Idh/MocA family oxidoreductase [Vicinamibacterales bacterium]|nr:Gfo/Idh/MocA family oxidoreductase [Vicinamibacterales bacterium]
MRVAVIGCGSIGTRHARNLKALGHWVSAFDTDAEKAFRLAVQCHGDPKQAAFCPTDNWRMFGPRDQFDAVFICTPASTHAAVASELLEVGYVGPLYVEKPLAMSVEEAEIFRVWPHPVVMVGYNWRWNRDLLEFREQSGSIEFLHFVCATRIADWPGRAYGDPLLECSHEIDLVRWWLGEFDVEMAGGRSGGFFLQSRDAVVDLWWNVAPPRRLFSAKNTRGLSRTLIPSPASIDDSYRSAIREFLCCVASRRVPSCTVADGIAVLNTVARARELAA